MRSSSGTPARARRLWAGSRTGGAREGDAPAGLQRPPRRRARHPVRRDRGRHAVLQGGVSPPRARQPHRHGARHAAPPLSPPPLQHELRGVLPRATGQPVCERQGTGLLLSADRSFGAAGGEWVAPDGQTARSLRPPFLGLPVYEGGLETLRRNEHPLGDAGNYGSLMQEATV